MTTIDEIYAAINPMPALLCAKGKKNPSVRFDIEANVGVRVSMHWTKPGSDRDWDRNYECFIGDTAHETIAKAINFINALPDAKTARLHDFMGQLGKVIDSGREPRQVHPEMMLEMLWRDELFAASSRLRIALSKKPTRPEMIRKLLEQCSLPELQREVCTELRARQALWRADPAMIGAHQ